MFDRLGQAAVFLMGGLSRDERAVPILLRSGDVLIMSGPRCRRAFHGKLGTVAVRGGARSDIHRCASHFGKHLT